MAVPPKPTPVKHCEHCGKQLVRKRWKNGVLESLLHFGRRKYCGRSCMAAAFDERGKKEVGWSTAHYHARKPVAPGPCNRCGAQDARDVHHLDGDHLNNSPKNLERICRSCHNREHRPKGSCTICGKPVKGYGYCDRHYQRFKRWGDPLMVKDNQFVEVRKESDPKPVKICSVAGCKSKAHAKGMCNRHYMKEKRRMEKERR